MSECSQSNTIEVATMQIAGHELTDQKLRGLWFEWLGEVRGVKAHFAEWEMPCDHHVVRIWNILNQVEEEFFTRFDYSNWVETCGGGCFNKHGAWGRQYFEFKAAIKDENLGEAYVWFGELFSDVHSWWFRGLTEGTPKEQVAAAE